MDIAWAQARQIREMASFMHLAEARNRALGAYDSQAHDSAVAEVALMLRASAGTAAARVGGAWSLCTRLPVTVAVLEAGRITLAKARIIDAETLNLTDERTAAVEAQVLAQARQQTPGQGPPRAGGPDLARARWDGHAVKWRLRWCPR